MSTWNTTYNYNQQTMNFGQSMLYGAFGQLTGMLGGSCGGVGNMYGSASSFFGMNGSLFSMSGIGGYGYGSGCCGMYSYGPTDGQVGAACGFAAMNVIFQGLGENIKARRTAKAAATQAAETASGNIETLNKEIATLSDENKALGDKSKGGINDDGTVNAKAKELFSTEAGTYESAFAKLSNYTEASKESLPSCGLSKAKYHINSTAQSTIDEYKDALTAADLTSSDPVKKQAAETKKADAESRIKAAIVKSEQDYDADVKAKDAAAEALKKKVVAKIEANDAEIKKKQDDLKKAQETVEEVAAGSTKKPKNYEKSNYESDITFKTNDDGSRSTDSNDNYEISSSYDKAKFRNAFLWNFSRYCIAPKSQKETYAKEGIAIGLKISDEGDADNDIQQKLKILENGGKIPWGQ